MRLPAFVSSKITHTGVSIYALKQKVRRLLLCRRDVEYIAKKGKEYVCCCASLDDDVTHTHTHTYAHSPTRTLQEEIRHMRHIDEWKAHATTAICPPSKLTKHGK